MKTRSRLVLLLCVALLAPVNPSYGLTAPQVAEDRDSGYNRGFFKHWIDADRNGCDTRAEVLISEAVVKPKVDKKCKISGGKWLSSYDNKSVANASQLDVDHLVPLAEAWRSGAWAWTPKQRQDFANDLSDKRALIAVTLSTNRSKGDKDISEWVPKVDTCGYVKNWIAIKIRYSLTYDVREAAALANYFDVCTIGDIPVEALSDYSYQSRPVGPSAPSPTPAPTSSPTPSPSPDFGTKSYITTPPFIGITYKEFQTNFPRVYKNPLVLVEVIDPPSDYLTEDLNDSCVIQSTSPEGTNAGALSKNFAISEGEKLRVLVRCRWILAESISGASWKWRKGTSKTPLLATDCPRLIEIEIDGFKALQCVPSAANPTPSPKSSSSPSSSNNGSKQCWVNGYTTKKGTTVKGYYRAC
jgi:hypothetical protein